MNVCPTINKMNIQSISTYKENNVNIDMHDEYINSIFHILEVDTIVSHNEDTGCSECQYEMDFDMLLKQLE